jgi:hypothetical protein
MERQVGVALALVEGAPLAPVESALFDATFVVLGVTVAGIV